MAIQNAAKGVTPMTSKVGKSVGRLVTSQVGWGVALDIGLGKLTGRSTKDSIKSAIGTAAFVAIAPGAFAVYSAASLLAPLPGAYMRAGKDLQDRYNQGKRSLTVPTFSYQDTQQAVTMRQAAVQAIQGSKLNARNALGGEASLMHRSHKTGRFN